MCKSASVTVTNATAAGLTVRAENTSTICMGTISSPAQRHLMIYTIRQ